jgi:murein tripeptide amidase MpaA
MIHEWACSSPRAKIAVVIPIAFGLIFISSFASPSTPQAPQSDEIVSIALTPGLAAKLRPLGLDCLFEWEGRVYVLVSPGEINRLDQSGVPYLLESHKFPALRQGPSLLQGGINGEYHSYSELEAALESLEQAHPQIAQLSTVGLSLENRNIFALKISDNVTRDEEEAEVLFTGCHHAREWISVEVPLLLAQYLLENYASDPQVRRAVDRSEIWIVPLVNPDGLEYSIRSYRYWRKNRRLNADGSFGVDLNRNYGYAWGYDDSGSSPEPASEVYRGAAPFSEPETRAVRDLFEQRDFRALVSYHSFSQVILFPWGYADIPTGQEARDGSIASAMSSLMRAVNGRVYEYGASSAALYLTNGDTTDWAFGIAGIPAYTIELPPVDELGGGFFNAETEIQPIFRENLPAALYLIDWAIADFGAPPTATSPPLLPTSSSQGRRK